MDTDYIETKAAGEIKLKSGANTRLPYAHQRDAINAMNKLNKKYSTYSTLIVLPTGGGKTYTASIWLLKNALDRGKKILWLAHRQTLPEQAAESFQKYAFSADAPHISSFNYRIISGVTSHERTSDIKSSDNLLIISKDSIGRNLNRLDNWLAGEDEFFLVIDEAHHSTAKTYRKVIDYVKERVKNLKLIGLTATPFRTAESEQGLLAKIYADGTRNGQAVKNDVGIVYQVGLKELINRRILSSPKFETYYTEQEYGEDLGSKAWESIQHLDKLPDDVAQEIAESTARNKLIVEKYKKKSEEYGQTIVFTVSINHAIALTKLFNEAGIKAEYIVSNVKDMRTGVTISREDNERKIESYKNGDIQILVNVNILTEGVDLPQTKTVFLTRPTVSTTLMTQMVGRALRGSAAGGTDEAYIVSFVDNWNDRIAWVNPDTLFTGTNDFDDSIPEYQQHELRLISIAKIEEFASILSNNIDTTKLEAVPFIQRIPLGMYAFQYINEEGIDFSYQVMVYDSTKDAYEKFMQALPTLSDDLNSSEEYLPKEILNKLVAECEEKFFNREMIPPYDKKDVEHILKYYAQKGECPNFYTFEHINRNKLDVSKIAQKIIDERMYPQEQANYLNKLWNEGDENILRLFFGDQKFFLRMVNIEQDKILYPDIYKIEPSKIIYDRKKLEELPLHEIEKYNPKLAKKLREGAFEKAKVKGGYKCAMCGKIFSDRKYLQVDHKKAMNNGGLSVPENLQILCRSCNAKKSDNEDGLISKNNFSTGGNVYIDDRSETEKIISALPEKFTDEEKEFLKNAFLNKDKKFIMSIKYDNSELFDSMCYILDKKYRKVRIKNSLAKKLMESNLTVKLFSDKLDDFLKITNSVAKNLEKDEKFFKEALLDDEGKYIVKNFTASDGCENHMLVLKNFKLRRLNNYMAKRLYSENKALKLTPSELEEFIKNYK